MMIIVNVSGKSPIGSSLTNRSTLNINSYNQYCMALSQNVTPDNATSKIQFPNNKQFKDLKAQSFLETNNVSNQGNGYENLQQSKSTKVSPTRYSVAQPMQSSNKLSFNNNNGLQYIENLQNPVAKLRSDKPQHPHHHHSGSMHQNHSQFNLRMPIDAALNSNLVSQTQALHQRKRSKDHASITGGNSISCEDNSSDNHSSMHQSFINLIYPSKSKKLITNESHFINNKEAHHHQKSKSLFIGEAPSYQNDNGIQKIQHSQYKKQSQVFNYSKRLKQLLKDNSEDNGHQIMHHNYNNNGGQVRHHQVFSQQHSPSNSQQQKMNLMLSSNTIDSQNRQPTSKSNQKSQQMMLIQSTFDKINSQTTDYLPFQQTVDQLQQQQQSIPPQISYTLDYFANKPNHQKSLTSTNTPSNINDHIKLQNEQANSKSSHMRKPSQPIKNNFIIEIGNQQPNAIRIDQKQGRDLSQEFRERSYDMTKPQHQQQHHRDKKHQPTQSKIQHQNKQGLKVSHQRSQSDFNVEQISQMKQLNRFTNASSIGDLGHPEIIANDDPFHNPTPKAMEVDRTSSFLKQYSQVIIETQNTFNSKTQSTVMKSDNKEKKNLKHSYIEQTSNQPKIDTKNIYHQRKLSFQPVTSAISTRKSPSKHSFIYKENTKQTNNYSRKASPKPILQQHQQQTLKQAKQNLNSSKSGKSNNTASFSHKTSTITSLVGGVLSSSNLTSTNHHTFQKTSLNQHQCNKNCHCLKQNQSSSATALMLHHQRSKSDINAALFQQVKTAHDRKSSVSSNTQVQLQHQQQQLQYQQQNNNNSKQLAYNRSSTLNSEKISPRKQSSTRVVNGGGQQIRQKVANISIDLYKGSSGPVQHIQRCSSKPLINNSSISNISSVSQKNLFKRKDSFVQQQKRDISPQGKQQHKNTISYKNSPSKTLFQKSQQQALQLKTQATSNFNLAPSSMFSPSNRSSSFVQLKNPNVSKRYEVVDISDESIINISQNNIGNANDSYKQQQFNQQRQNQLSETEQLLKQIRSKGCKVVQTLDLHEESFEKHIAKMNDNHIKQQQQQQQQNLYKITEHSVEQHNIDTLVHNSQRPQYANLQLNTHDSSSLYLTTDPNLSPLSKGFLKLKKLIKFNFNKYNEAPQTTSDFYRIGRVLGRGAFGKVNLAAHKLSEQLVAIKSINKEFLKSEEDQKKKIMQEFGILKQSDHPSVVRLYDSFETNKHICFVMELCSGGDLLTYVRKRRKLKEDVAKYFFKQIIEGLAYIHHSKLIVHRDIKLDNILLDANGKIKICDFGVSRQVSSETEKMTEQCGTPAYIAPEILRDKGYEGFKVDVWSAGVCLYAMLIGTVPFKAASMNELHHMIIGGKYDLKEEKLSDPAKDLISKLLQVDPKKRLSAYEVLGHPWLKDTTEIVDIFTQKEKDSIYKEYISKNIDRQNRNLQQANNQQDTECLFTEHNLDTKSNNNSLLKNASTKSLVLAPFNSTISDYENEEGKLIDWPEEVKNLIINKKVIKFGPKIRDLNRQYEQNNNADLDNGVYNNIENDQDKDEEVEKSKSSIASSQDSLKKSFKETELSSDDEKADKQIEDAYDRKMKYQSELQEFEQQLKLRYVKYQEPVHKIDQDVIAQIVRDSVYPIEYLLKILNNKEMNYATAHYNLLVKKKSLEQTILLNGILDLSQQQ